MALVVLAALEPRAYPQSSSTSSSGVPNRSQHERGTSHPDAIDPGTVSNGIYRNKTFGFTCKIPAGWVLRTDEMNAPDENDENQDGQTALRAKASNESQPSPTRTSPKGSLGPVQNQARVLLATFSRPPEAHGEEVNSSIVIAAEPVIAYPGLKEAAQYFGPLTEVAQAQGFTVDEEPYEIAIGTKTLVRGDFHKDVGTRVMRQSTLAMLMRGYAVSFTVIGGTEDEVEDLIDGLDFVAARPPAK